MLRKHARRVHPSTRPADIDPSKRRAWHRLEHQREYGGILSAIRSAMPGAVMFGDYAVEAGDMLSHDRGEGSSRVGGSLLTTFLLFHMMRSSPAGSGDEPRVSSSGLRRQRRHYLWRENLLGLQYDDDEDIVEAEVPPDVREVRRRGVALTRRGQQPWSTERNSHPQGAHAGNPMLACLLS